MQDRYVGDIGDYCKLGLLRALTWALAEFDLSLAINWYKTEPAADKPLTQNHGKFTEYLKIEKLKDCYIKYDEELHQQLWEVIDNNSRDITSIDKSIVNAKFYYDPVPKSQKRKAWHDIAIEKLFDTNIVFLDPDNGIETEKMMAKSPSPKHVLWPEIEEYYKRGQSVLIYQHKYRITDSDFIKNIIQLQREFINADSIRIIKYSSYGIRYFIFFLHKKHCKLANAALTSIEKRGLTVTKELSSIKKKKTLPKFCEVIYPSKK